MKNLNPEQKDNVSKFLVLVVGNMMLLISQFLCYYVNFCANSCADDSMNIPKADHDQND